MRKTILKAIALLAIPFAMVGLSSGDTYADVSTIPEGQPFTDINFYNCVVNKIGTDNVAETGPTTEQLESITSLRCSGDIKPDTEKIKDASGLEKMTALTYFNLDSNQLTSIDVSHNTALTYLNLNYNQLTSIDVSHNTALISLGLYSNQLTSIDISNNTALTSLTLSSNKLTSVDVSNNTALTHLGLNDNQLISIDVSHSTALEDFYADDIFVKTAITSSDATGPKQYDLNTLKFFISVIPEGDGYAYNGESKILTVQNPLSTNYIQVDNQQNTDYQKYKLVLYEGSTPTPTPTPDQEDNVKVPDTGMFSSENGNASAIFAITTFVILSTITAAAIHKKHASGHFKYDE